MREINIEIPYELRQIEALLNRISKEHPKRSEIEKVRNIKRAGLRGEQHVDFHLSFLPQPNQYTILKALRLTDPQTEYKFQIDRLLLSPNYFLIIEAKNISGLLRIDPTTHQLIQENKQTLTGYSNPAQQAERQKQRLQSWVKRFKIDLPPIEYISTFNEKNSIFQTSQTDKRLFNRILFAENLLQKIAKFEKTYLVEIIHEKTIRKVKRLLIQHHQPKILNVLTEFSIKQQELITGVQCPICECFTMIRSSGSWRCSNCNSLSKTAHEKGIIEFILINQVITSQQCKKFLCLPSIHIAYQLLKQIPLAKKGGNKNRVYFLQPKYPE